MPFEAEHAHALLQRLPHRPLTHEQQMRVERTFSQIREHLDEHALILVRDQPAYAADHEGVAADAESLPLSRTMAIGIRRRERLDVHTVVDDFRGTLRSDTRAPLLALQLAAVHDAVESAQERSIERTPPRIAARKV